MSREEFAAFSRAWMLAVSLYLIDGGLLATFIVEGSRSEEH
jgi:hypothetical protein